MSSGLIAAVAAGLFVSLVGEGTGRWSLRAAGKLVASLAFLGLGISLGLADKPPHGPWILVAFVLSVVGDLALLSDRKAWFLGGLVAFLLAHVGFAAAFLTLGPAWWAVGASLVPLLAIVALVWRWLGPHTGKLKGPVIAYVSVITAMVALAAGVAAGVTGGMGLGIAAVLFFCSDLFVARQRFIVTTPWNRYVGLPLYYVAQVLFAYAATWV